MLPNRLLAVIVSASGAFGVHNPLLDAPLVIAGKSERLIKTLDLDGDGWEDAIGAWRNSPVGAQYALTSKLSGWINDRHGHLVETWNLTQPLHAEAIEPHDGTATGDLDGDGREDFVVSDGLE